MSEPSLSEIAKVPAGSAFNDRGAALEEESWRRLTQRNPLRNVRPHWEIWLLRHRKTRRTTGYTFFERRAGTNNRGNLEHTVDLIRGGLSVTRQETPGFPQVREVTFVITESNSRSPFSIAGGASPFTPQGIPLIQSNAGNPTAVRSCAGAQRWWDPGRHLVRVSAKLSFPECTRCPAGGRDESPQAGRLPESPWRRPRVRAAAGP
jgi:hypothetical protein